MHNLDDDRELDRISREAAGNYATPGQPDWDAMQQLLDEVMPAEKEKRRFVFFWWLFPLLLLGGGTVMYRLMHTDEPVTANQTIQHKEQAVTATQQPAPTLTAAIPATPVENPVRSTISAAKTRNQDIKHATAFHPAPAESIQQEQATVFISHTDSVSANTLTKEQQHTNRTALQLQSHEEKRSAEQVTGTGSDTGTAKNSIIKQKPRRQTAFSFALLAGADESTVKFRYGNQAGVNIGLMAGYHFSRRWSIHSGVIYTQKNYKMAGQDFTAPKGSIISYYKLETVDGYCRMWEVPLLARYTLNPSAKNTIFLSTGLSSYFMTRENYNYFYYYNNQPVTRSYSYPSDDTHVLSIWHLSAGFDKPIGRHLSLQVEPYAKLPLGGIGLGNIRLSSFGVNFSVQFRQPAKKP